MLLPIYQAKLNLAVNEKRECFRLIGIMTTLDSVVLIAKIMEASLKTISLSHPSYLILREKSQQKNIIKWLVKIKDMSFYFTPDRQSSQLAVTPHQIYIRYIRNHIKKLLVFICRLTSSIYRSF